MVVVFELLGRNKERRVVSFWSKARVNPDTMINSDELRGYYPGRLFFSTDEIDELGWDEIKRRTARHALMLVLKESGADLYEFDVDNNGKLVPHPNDDLGQISVWWDTGNKRVKIVVGSEVDDERVKRKILARLRREARVIAERKYGWLGSEVEIEVG